MNNNNRPTILTWLLLVVLILISSFNIYLLIVNSDSLNDRLNDHERNKIIIEKVEKAIDAKMIDESKVRDIIQDYIVEPEVMHGQHGKDGKDGKDGVPGKDGKDGIDGKNGRDGKDGVDGKDAPIPIIRCNSDLNRWEVRYSEEDVWEIMNGEVVKCTIGG